MRVIQITNHLNAGDGVGNIILMMDRVLSKHYYSVVATRSSSINRDICPRLFFYQELDCLMIDRDDIVIYHFAGYEELGIAILELKCKKLMLYHNVTYPYFFVGINEDAVKFCAKGQQYIRNVVGAYLGVIAPSQFSCDGLLNMGWRKQDVYLLPHPVSLEKKPIGNRNNKGDGYKQFLFVGRVVPNKKIEDVIRIFDFYQNNYNKKCKLKIVGSIKKDAYYEALIRYVENTKADNIVFMEHVTDAELDRIYRDSDIYLCMSEHEGFCMPLIEAMSYEIPVVAYNATAVPDTMGDAGILLDSKDPEYVCKKIDRIFEDEAYRNQLIKGQNRHIDSYIRDDYEKKLLDIIEEVKAISSYSYDESSIEFYKILLEEIEKSGEECLQKQIQKLKDMGKPVVMYGAGKVGTHLLSYFTSNELSIEAVCDAGKYGEEIEGQMILSLQDCALQYSDAIYIITVQNSITASEISDDLFGLGLSRSNILRYLNSNKMIVL